jgi:hypothetical protein
MDGLGEGKLEGRGKNAEKSKKEFGSQESEFRRKTACFTFWVLCSQLLAPEFWILNSVFVFVFL